MRKFLIVVGAATCLIVIAIGAGFAFLAVKGGALDAESKQYVDDAVQAITAKWSKDELRARASPELLGTVKTGDLENLFGMLAQLGTLIEYQGATGQANMSYFTGSGSTTSASYVAKAKYQNGEATIDLKIEKRDGTWMIHYFHVNLVPGTVNERGT